MVVWPELSAPAKGDDLEPVLDLARRPNMPPFVTTYEDGSKPKPFNVARIFSRDGASQPYKKRKPFAGEAQMHAAGSRAVAVTAGGHTYGLNICFDSAFPKVMRETARLPGVEVILLPTLDPDTQYGIVQALHAAYTPFRAAELGIPIVRADTTAYSMAVDARGNALAECGPTEDTLLLAKVAPGKRWTFVTYAGDWFLGVCALLALIGLRSGRQVPPQDST